MDEYIEEDIEADIEDVIAGAALADEVVAA